MLLSRWRTFTVILLPWNLRRKTVGTLEHAQSAVGTLELPQSALITNSALGTSELPQSAQITNRALGPATNSTFRRYWESYTDQLFRVYNIITAQVARRTLINSQDNS